MSVNPEQREQAEKELMEIFKWIHDERAAIYKKYPSTIGLGYSNADIPEALNKVVGDGLKKARKVKEKYPDCGDFVLSQFLIPD